MRIFFKKLILCLALAVFVSAPLASHAQQGLGISISPAMFQMNLKPGETWTGQIKVVNNNSYDITYYASAVNFRAANEGGQPKFEPIVQEDDSAAGTTLAYWIDITQDPIPLKAEQSKNIPFAITVPEEAPPGGHYAAILIGTKPVKQNQDGPVTLVSSFVSSLLFMRVQGDVVEDGLIREFTTDKAWYQKPEVDFSVRFQNDGNVHVRPQGEIKIYNMWGKDRGNVPINQFVGFGNVLPGTVRDFKFQWNGEQNIFDIGRYKAELTLSYGLEASRNLTSEVYFWVIPLRSTLGVLGGFIAFISLIVFSLRWYVRRAFKMQARQLGLDPANIKNKPELQPKAKLVKEPKIKQPKKKSSSIRFFTLLLKKYWKTALVLSLIISGIALSALFLKENLTQERSFEITIDQEQGNNVLK